MRALSLAVVGISHPNKRGVPRRFELLQCSPGEAIELRPEPKNKHDEYAVAVFSARGVQLGYLSAERAPWIKGIMGRGVEVQAIYQGQAEHCAWIRVAFDGEVPTLPPARIEVAADADGFYPDEPGGEWGA